MGTWRRGPPPAGAGESRWAAVQDATGAGWRRRRRASGGPRPTIGWVTLLPPPAPGVVVAPFRDGLVAFDPRTQELHRLRGSAELVWRACADGRAVDALVAGVAEATGLEEGTVEDDVLAFVADLRDKSLVGSPATSGRPFDDATGEGGARGVAGAVAAGGENAGGAPSGGRHRSRALVVLDDRVVVRSDDPAHVAEIEAGFGTVEDAATLEYAVARAGDGSLHLEDLSGRGPARSVHAGHLLAAVVAETNQVACTSRAVLALHAGGVRAPSGDEVVVLAAPSGSGKSTLTAALLRRGWDYVSDEAVGIRAGSLEAVPYPKPLSLGPVSRQALGLEATTGIVPLDRVVAGCTALTGEAGPVRAVVLPRFEAGAEPSIEWLEPEDALFALGENAFNLAAAGQAALDTLVELALRVPVARLVHGGAPSAVDVVAEVVERTRNVGAVGA